jgi:hypothetical protein
MDFDWVNPAQLLTKPFLERYADATQKGCWDYDYAVADEVGKRRAVRPGWERIPELRRYNADNHSGDQPIYGPLLVLAGDDDQSVNFTNVKNGVDRACKSGGENHRPTTRVDARPARQPSVAVRHMRSMSDELADQDHHREQARKAHGRNLRDTGLPGQFRR